MLGQHVKVRVPRTLLERMRSLLEPGLARIGRTDCQKGTRELIEWPYIIVYKVDDSSEEIIVLAVVHGRQRR